MATITTFEAGFCTHPACIAVRGSGWRACAFPARAYLIETRRGRWLWDTGYASHFLDATRSGLFALYRRVTPVRFDPAEAVRAQLRRRGIEPDDLNAVILSHFHGDHIAGLKDFPGVPSICSGAGWRQTRSLRGAAALRRGFVPGLIPPDFERDLAFIERFEPAALPPALAPFAAARAVPGADGELLLVELPGHAAGHIGAFVDTADGWVLLAADAAWSPLAYRERRGPSRLAHLILESPADYYATLERLRQLDRGGIEIRLTHEGAL